MNASPQDAERFLSLLWREGDVYELRGLVKVNGQQHVTSGYFDNAADLARAACARSGKDAGVYITLNPTNPALLARAPKNTVRRAGNGDTTSDRDVRHRRSILVDIDPVRPAGISSSNEEHETALELARRVLADLATLGWPEPIFADSGNGAHLIYAVDLPVDDGGLIKRVLEKLSRTYTTPTLKIDEKVFNAARISKIYGTLTRKGESTEDRPHRIARILEAPDALAIVTRDQLEQFAPIATPVRNGQANGHGHVNGNGTRRAEFSLDGWIAEHLPDAQPTQWTEGRKWLLPVCPFNSEHDRKEAYVVEKHSGVIAAGCQHESCFKTWHELRERFEPDAYARRNGTSTRPEPEVVYEAEDYTRSDDDAFADRDAEPDTSWHDSVRGTAFRTPPPWKRGPELPQEIWSRRNDPWVSLKLAGEELVRIRAGGIAVVMGGSGSGKSSLVSNLLIEHARNHGPAIALSIELPADELAARIVGIQCDASWEQALRGHVELHFMEQALDMTRLYVIDRKQATIANLAKAAAAAAREFPGEPILAAIDYAQLVQSKEREVRLRVADALSQIDDVARERGFVAIAVSQMSRASASQAAQGEKIGAESAALGAESAAIERFASVTLSIGKRGEPRGDGSALVELSIGKGRMSDMGDRVIPLAYIGRTGLWRVAGEAKAASQVRDERDVERAEKRSLEIANLLVGAAHRSNAPLSREQLQKLIPKGSKKDRLAAIESLLASGELVEVARNAPRSRSWTLWTVDRAREAGIDLVRDIPEGAQ